jgi:ATP-dependent helicase/DNAse subunit B
MAPMPITLLTGPANAGKARVVLDALRAHRARAEHPLLVVPTRADVELYRRELVRGGLASGVRVERFAGLLAEVLRRAGSSERPLGRIARERVLSAALRRTAGERATPGVVRSLAALVGELEVERVSPVRLRGALGAWTAADPTHAPHTRVLGELFEEYRHALERLARAAPERRAARALDALRRTPALWGATPVLLYGFDDFTRLQLDTIETLGAVVGAPMTVSLAYEPGRTAFAGRGDTFQRLLPLASEHRRLDPRAEHCAPGSSRLALHHLERYLFEPDAPAPVRAGDALRLLEGGGERAELELVAEEILGLLERGVAPEEIAVAHRSPATIAQLLEEVFGAYNIPFALERRLPFAHTALGRALLGLLGAAFPDGEDDGLGDLLAWLRAPGVLRHPELADELEWRARRAGVNGVARARALWEAEHWPLELLDRLREAAERSPAALLERVAAELQRLARAARPHGPEGLTEGPSPSGLPQACDWDAGLEAPSRLSEARALEVGRVALEELHELARSAPDLAPDAHELIALLHELDLVVGAPPPPETLSPSEAPTASPAKVAVLDPLALRARRVRALFLCGLQEGVFPASARPEPYLSEEERRGLAEASGLRLGRPRDALAAERYLLYAAVSRPEEVLVLSWHTADDDGLPSARSLFVDDICDLFSCDLHNARSRRALGEVGRMTGSGGPVTGAPPAGPLAVGLPAMTLGSRDPACGGAVGSPAVDPPAVGSPAVGSPGNDHYIEPSVPVPGIAPLRDPRVLAELGGQRLWSASGLQSWTGCPVQWFVERLLGARGLQPEAEPLARGGLAHAVLHDVLEGLRLQHGSARLLPERLPRARELLHAALETRAAERSLSTTPERVPGVRRRLEADLERYLEYAAERGEQDSPLEPTHLELSFGFTEPDQPPALDLGEGVLVRGVIDRVDFAPGGEAVVYDYKSAYTVPPDRWLGERNFQIAIYMRAVERLLGARVVGGFYQPLSGRDLRARGVLAEGEGVELQCVRGDVRPPEAVQDLVEEILGAARAAAAQARAGELEARPSTCGFGDAGCRYPSICRCEL